MPALALPGRSAPGAPPVGGTRLVAVDDPDLQVTAVEPRPDGSLRVRVLNAVPEVRRARVGLAPGLACAGLVDLADRPDAATPLEREPDAALALTLRGWQLATLQLRAGPA